MRRIIIISGILACLFSVPMVTTILAQEMVVGTLFDHSGALKEWGPRHQQAVELAGGQMAEAGFQIGWIHEDSQTSADAAIKAARKLVEGDNVPAIIGSGSSGVIIPVAEAVAIPEDVVMISPGATSPYITNLPEDKEKDMIFRTCPSDTLQGVVLGKLAASQYKTASVMYINNPYGQGLARQFRRSFTRRGGTVYTMIPHGEEVAESYAAELRNAFARMYSTKPFRSGRSDVLCVFSYPEHAKVYVKEAIELYDCKNFLFCDGSKSEELASVVGAANVEGSLGTAPGVAVGEAFFNFKNAYTESFGDLPTSPFIANAYDAAAVIGLAAYAARVNGVPLNSKNIRDQLRVVANPPGAFIGPGQFAQAFKMLDAGKPINYEGASGTIDFDSHGDVVSPIEIWRFSGGRIVTYRMEYQISEE